MIEKKLREGPLLAPSDALDRQIHAMIRDSALYRRNLIGRPVPMWISVAACAVFALLGFFADRWMGTAGPESKQIIYVVESTDALRNLVRAQNPKAAPGFFQTKITSIEVITPSNKRSETLSFEEGL